MQIENNPDITIEHIFPQKPTLEWERELGGEFEKMKLMTNTAGNLTLSAFNSALSNRRFTEKRDMPVCGYRHSPLRLDKTLANLEAWNPTEMERRTEWICSRVRQIWPYPTGLAVAPVVNDDQLDLDLDFEYDILELDPALATNRRLEEMTFEGRVCTNPTFRTLLEMVSNTMFEREPEIFFDLDSKNKLSVCSDIRLFGAPIRISSQYYIEGNLSAKEIVRRVQMILEACASDDELLVRFAKS